MTTFTKFSQLQLHTSRLLLRPLVESDAQDLFAIFSDPRVMRYWSMGPWQTVEQAKDSIAKDQEAMALGKHMRLGIERTKDGNVIGTCSLFQFSEQCRRAEVGFALASSAWKQGYMHEALSRCLDYAFGDLSLIRVEADVDPRNDASAHCLERLGFIKEGHLRQRWIVDKEVSDSAIYGLLSKDWGPEHCRS